MKTKLILFGITGDLSKRKLIPALSKIMETGDYNDLSVIGVSRSEPDKQELLGEFYEQLGDTTTIFSMDLSKPEEYIRLRDSLRLQKDEQALFYLSVPPTSAVQIVEYLGEAGLNTANVKVMLEKPFGTNLGSARDMITHIAKYYDESQLYRIDHYLAKEMSQNIVAIRSKNALFDHIWNNQAIEKIEVLAYEQISIEGRAVFYEETGALRDIVQGHLMELLSLVLMDIPADFDWDTAAIQRSAALQYIQPADPTHAVRAQYSSYRDEVDNQESMTETFVKLALESTDPRWQGVGINLIAGKALDRKATEIRVTLRKSYSEQANILTFRIQPLEGLEVEIFVKAPGYGREFEAKNLAYYDNGARLPDAYEQVIVDAIRGHKSLFASSDEVIRAWEIVSPVQDAWVSSNQGLITYQSGSDALSVA